MVEPSAPGNGRKAVEYRSVVTLGNLLSILAMMVTVSGGLMWWYGDVQSRLTALETKMDFAQAALNAVAQKMGIRLTAVEAEAGTRDKRTR